MYDLDEHLTSWVTELSNYLSAIKANPDDYCLESMKIIFEAALETYLSIIQPNTTDTVRAILTRTLIECYADANAIFRHDNPEKQAKKYINYARKLDRLFKEQSQQYVSLRDSGKQGETRPFEIIRTSMVFWNGKNIMDRVQSIKRDPHIVGYYEFFSLFAHMNPVRHLYLAHFNADPAIGKYYSYIMLSIMQCLALNERLPERLFEKLNKIASDYAADYAKRDFSPKLKD